ncbi:hypothetical protein [Olleya marilimosa]|uniref:hypothetical protein n=1 Tax=Olleya marilimosa TaxID=272164 RepID=UPI0030ECD570|tara:strand:- start:30561 stop:31133 length:573 start_codon:yes stop_codon:yes gene_type:complete
MKIKYLLYFGILVLLGCGSSDTVTKTSKRITYYKCLDTIEAKAKMKFYSMTIPDSWCTYVGSHDVLSHAPNNLKDLRENEFKNGIYVMSPNSESFKSKNIEEALERHFLSVKNASFLTPKVRSQVHPIYGKYYIVTSKSITDGFKVIRLSTLFNHNNKDYLIYYSVLEKDVDTYIEDAMSIIETFKIIEQ